MALPFPFSTFPRVELMFPYPTKIQYLERVSKDLSPNPSGTFLKPGPSVKIYAKREDCNSPLAFGGNKMRKLEYVVPEIVSEKADVIVTVGGPQSNHMRQCAAVAAKLGIRAILCKSGPFANSPAPTPSTVTPIASSGSVAAATAGAVQKSHSYNTLGNIQLSSLMGAVYTTNTPSEIMEEMKRENRKPYYIPSGASTHPLGGLGYARFAFEVLLQEEELGVFFNDIIVPSASGSTLGGMVAGFKLALKDNPKLAEKGTRRLIGVDASAKPLSLRQTILNIAKDTGEKIGVRPEEFSETDFMLDERYSAGEYGKADETTLEAVKYAASMEGMMLDPVYTGKAFAGLLGMVGNGEVSGNVLFLHTGGAMVLSGYRDVI